ncbi:MAG TPA: protein-glutamate O-methyltransferase CheR [Polyangiaceae bacterium]|nr:protein-glutamate O-methyltransferase CheR [Polyangiaceae bacterium]
MSPEEKLDELEELELRLLLDAIHGRYGYRFHDYTMSSLRRRVRVALARSGLSHLGELQHKLLHEPACFGQVLDALTVRVSDMFRDPPFFAAFRQRVVPLLRTYPLLKIWHAGCASGEEVYATAILLSEENLYDRSQIYATDMSGSALEAARQGIYVEGREEEFTQNYRQSGGRAEFSDYCTRGYGGIAMRETLKRNVVFFQHNLASDYALGEMHVIFCRNVLIYFGHKLRDQVFRTFDDSLSRGGFLCLGKSEGLPPGQARTFAPFDMAERIYQRRNAE